MYHRGVKEVAAFVLAGGKSSRMGRDKAFLELGGRTLLAHALALARAVGREVTIVGDAKKFSAYGRVVEDVYRDRGPLGGIHAALTCSTTDFNLVLAVDLPFVEAKFLDYLNSQAQASGAMVTVAQIAGDWQPLCAVYRRDFAAVAEKSLQNGKNKIDLLFAEVERRVIDEDELSRTGFSAEMFRNLNTTEDMEQARNNC